jgi:hypothetical protein
VGVDERKVELVEGDSNEQQTEAVMKVNMVFVILEEFRAPESDVADLALGTERVVFEKPVKPEEHMKPLYVKGHLDGVPVNRMMIDGKASVNIMPMSLFKELGHTEGDLKWTNMSLSGFLGEPTEAKGIVSKGLTIGSKTMPTSFFVVDVKGRYNVLLGRDWIHANGCIPSTLIPRFTSASRSG